MEGARATCARTSPGWNAIITLHSSSILVGCIAVGSSERSPTFRMADSALFVSSQRLNGFYDRTQSWFRRTQHVPGEDRTSISTKVFYDSVGQRAGIARREEHPVEVFD